MAGLARSSHGRTVRGLTLSRGSKFFGGQFGRMFRALPPADFGESDTKSEENLLNLGKAMVADHDPPKDGPDAEESGIPAAYTYLGQFIDHDLTFDPASSLQQQDDPDGLVDFRTPRFDLDCVYGKGPDDAPYLYSGDNRFIQGRPLTGAASNPNARDLPRSQPTDPSQPEDINNSRRAIIGDPRNDENVIVSQFQGLMHRFHNKLMSEDTGSAESRFQRVQREVRFHYQWMLVNDFLPTIVWEDVLKDVIPHHFKNTNVRRDPPRITYFDLAHEPTMPLEFSAAAYRFGHSMVRPGYRLSETVPPLAIFDPDPNASLTGFHEFRSNWAIDWGRFMDLGPLDFGDENNPNDPGNSKRLQLAYRIDTSLVDPLGSLPNPPFAPPFSLSGGKLTSLAQRNLMRGWRMRLPSGQAIARAMGIEPLKDANILVGKFTGDPADIKGSVASISAAFEDNCPLWTYVLAETKEVTVTIKTNQGDKPINTRKLGPVGGRIVAETFIGLMLSDSSSYFNQNPIWTPSKANAQGRFGLRELIKTALS
ncbi:MAG TPA: heme peroxidase family protein [Candidatus Acidoferrum sp.]|nr:heme peroxidase family protein [Candidatus Acidoferrum sp.]